MALGLCVKAYMISGFGKFSVKKKGSRYRARVDLQWKDGGRVQVLAGLEREGEWEKVG
jgi:hypothetical protein